MNLCVRNALRRCQHGSRLQNSFTISSSILQTPSSSSSSSSYSTSKIVMLSTMPEPAEVPEDIPTEVKVDPRLVKKYVKSRKENELELNKQRKEWHKAYVESQRLKKIQQEEERRRIVLEKAQRDRVKTQESLKRQAADKERNRIFKMRFEDHLARNFIEFKRRRKAQQERYDSYLTDVMEESKCWLNASNIDDKINADLFSTQSTTGLVIKHSEHWRWQVMSINLKRMLSEELIRERSSDGDEKNNLSKRLDWAAQAENFKKFEVRDFLEEMVTDGRDREHLEELVDKFTKELDYHGAFDDDDFQWYFDLMFENFTRDHEKNPLRKLPGSKPYGANANQILKQEERFIAEHFDYPPQLGKDGKPLYPQELPYVPAEGDEDIIVPQRDPNERKMIRGKPVNLNRKGVTKKKKK